MATHLILSGTDRLVITGTDLLKLDEGTVPNVPANVQIGYSRKVIVAGGLTAKADVEIGIGV